MTGLDGDDGVDERVGSRERRLAREGKNLLAGLVRALGCIFGVVRFGIVCVRKIAYHRMCEGQREGGVGLGVKFIRTGAQVKKIGEGRFIQNSAHMKT